MGTDANQELLGRLQNAKPTVDPRAWEDEEVDRQALKFRLSQNASRGRLQKLRMPQRAVADKLPKIGRSQSELNENELAKLAKGNFDIQLLDSQHGLGGNQPALDFT